MLVVRRGQIDVVGRPFALHQKAEGKHTEAEKSGEERRGEDGESSLIRPQVFGGDSRPQRGGECLPNSTDGSPEPQGPLKL